MQSYFLAEEWEKKEGNKLNKELIENLLDKESFVQTYRLLSLIETMGKTMSYSFWSCPRALGRLRFYDWNLTILL